MNPHYFCISEGKETYNEEKTEKGQRSDGLTSMGGGRDSIYDGKVWKVSKRLRLSRLRTFAWFGSTGLMRLNFMWIWSLHHVVWYVKSEKCSSNNTQKIGEFDLLQINKILIKRNTFNLFLLTQSAYPMMSYTLVVLPMSSSVIHTAVTHEGDSSNERTVK